MICLLPQITSFLARFVSVAKVVRLIRAEKRKSSSIMAVGRTQLHIYARGAPLIFRVHFASFALVYMEKSV